MKHTHLAILLLAGTLNATAQTPIGGSVVYTRTNTYNFEPTGNDEWEAYAKTLPKEGKFEKVEEFKKNGSAGADYYHK